MCIVQKCLAYFSKLTLAQQHKAASNLKSRYKTETGNPSALLTRIMRATRSGVSRRSTTGITLPAKSPPMPAKPQNSAGQNRPQPLPTEGEQNLSCL